MDEELTKSPSFPCGATWIPERPGCACIDLGCGLLILLCARRTGSQSQFQMWCTGAQEIQLFYNKLFNTSNYPPSVTVQSAWNAKKGKRRNQASKAAVRYKPVMGDDTSAFILNEVKSTRRYRSGRLPADLRGKSLSGRNCVGVNALVFITAHL
jgi:hypothetical protein